MTRPGLTSWPAKSSPVNFRGTSTEDLLTFSQHTSSTNRIYSRNSKAHFDKKKKTILNRPFLTKRIFKCCLILMPTRGQIFPLFIVTMTAPQLLLSTNGGQIIIHQQKFLGTLFRLGPLTSLFLCRKMIPRRQKECTSKKSMSSRGSLRLSGILNTLG